MNKHKTTAAIGRYTSARQTNDETPDRREAIREPPAVSETIDIVKRLVSSLERSLRRSIDTDRTSAGRSTADREAPADDIAHILG